MAYDKKQRYDDDKPARLSAPVIPAIALPTTLTPVSTTLASRIQLWHGDPKIGKTMQAHHARGGTFFLKFEPGHDHIQHYGNVVNTWEEMIGNVDALDAAKKNRTPLPFTNICVDTCGMAFVRCTEYILTRLGVDHESDTSFGKGAHMIEREFRRQITRLCNLGFGVIMIAHSTDKTFSNGKTGTQKQEWTKRVVDLPKKAEGVIPPLADLILYFTKTYDQASDEWVREIKTQRTNAYDAGMRYPDGWTPLPETIPMSYEALEDAWNAGAPGEAAKRAEEAQRAREDEERRRAVVSERLSGFVAMFGPAKCREIVGRSTSGMTLDELESAVTKLERAQAVHTGVITHPSKTEAAQTPASDAPPPLPASDPPGSAPPPPTSGPPFRVVQGGDPPEGEVSSRAHYHHHRWTC
jgi:hypothetical protein